MMNSMHFNLERGLPKLFLILLLSLTVLSAWQWRGAAPISASLLDILPQGTTDSLQDFAQQRMQEPLDRELIVLLRHPDGAPAAQIFAEQLAQQWRASGIYQQVDSQLSLDLPAVRQQLLADRSNLLPLAVRQQLATQPELYFQQRLAELFDPLNGFALVSPEQDWLGLSAKIQKNIQLDSRVQVDSSGYLFVEDAGQHWLLLRARTHDSAFSGSVALQVAEQVQQARMALTADGGELLASSGLLFAAQGKTQAASEMQWLGGLSLLGSLLLIVALWRSASSLVALLPALFGLWVGLTACVAVFGHIHVLTLVLGASLIGVTIDFPMHYLSKAWTLQPWRSWAVLRATLPGLSLGVLTNAIGYLALAFTPFPALSQVAVFSVAGLIAAYVCTVCCLPWLLRHRQLQPWQQPLVWMQMFLNGRTALLRRVSSRRLLLALLVFSIAGIMQLNRHDDVRQWVSASPVLLEDAQRIAELTGYQPTSQFFLVKGIDVEQLLGHLQTLELHLHALQQAGDLRSYQSPHQYVAGLVGQPSLAQAVAQIPQSALAPLLTAGVSLEALQAELSGLENLPSRSVEDSLNGPLGEVWRPLWLGQQHGQYAAIVSLQGLSQVAVFSELAEQFAFVQWIDRPAELNQLFKQTQSHALWLKVLASGVIFVVLAMALGWRGALRTLSISLLAALTAAACLGWMGQTLTLFSVFGLLLVTAIGVDYAIIIYEGVGGAATSLLGTLLAAVTTWLSFGLLALSSTPAVSSFGLAVSLGLVFSFLFAPWAARPLSLTR
jgi:predicted exporter